MRVLGLSGRMLSLLGLLFGGGGRLYDVPARPVVMVVSDCPVWTRRRRMGRRDLEGR